MATPHELRELHERVEALEMKAAYAEDLLDTLNLTIYRQQEQIAQLQRQLQALQTQAAPRDAAAAPRSLRDELPPHY